MMGFLNSNNEVSNDGAPPISCTYDSPQAKRVDRVPGTPRNQLSHGETSRAAPSTPGKSRRTGTSDGRRHKVYVPEKGKVAKSKAVASRKVQKADPLCSFPVNRMPPAPPSNRNSLERGFGNVTLGTPSHPLPPPAPTEESSNSPLSYQTSHSPSSRQPSFVCVRASQNSDSMFTQDTSCSGMVARRLYLEFSEIRELGHGCFGRVLQVRELSSGEVFAVKICQPMQGAYDEAKKRNERDIMAIARNFPHCVRLFNSWIDPPGHSLHLQMQFCSGGTVERVADTRRKSKHVWSEVEVLTFLGQMGVALDALHSNHIAHVDFKLDNILIDGEGEYQLGDFGCALKLDARTGRPLSLRVPKSIEAFQDVTASTETTWSQDEGDSRYLALDMLNEKRHYKAGDMFSLGISLYELMTSAPLPFGGPEFHIIRQKRDFSDLQSLGYSEALSQLVKGLMSFDPTERPTADDVLRSPLLQIASDALPSVQQLNPSVTLPEKDAHRLRFHATCLEIAHYKIHKVLPPPALNGSLVVESLESDSQSNSVLRTPVHRPASASWQA